MVVRAVRSRGIVMHGSESVGGPTVKRKNAVAGKMP